MQHLELKFILTRLMVMSKGTRESLRSLNSALFDIFLRSYGLCMKLRRTDLAGKLNLITLLQNLERNMMKANRCKAQADFAYLTLMEKWQRKRTLNSSTKRLGFKKKQHSHNFLPKPQEPDELIYEFDQK